MRLFRIIALCALASAPGSLFAFALPSSARIVADSNSKDAWVQNAEFDMAFAAAENLMEARLLSCGFSKKNAQKRGGKNPISISLWESPMEKVIVMLWKISDSKTGVSWGYEK